VVSRTYTVTIPEVVPLTGTVTTSASPSAGGSTAGDGTYNLGTPLTVVATHNPAYAFVNWTEGGVEVSASEVYPFTVTADRTLVANFVPVTYVVTTSASPSTGGTTSGDGTYNSGDGVAVEAFANAGYKFVNWTEGGAAVSASAGYSFIAEADRALVANFVPKTPANLEIVAATAVHNGSKVDVTVTVGNSGETVAQGVTINSKKEATIDGKATNERPPIAFGDVSPGGTATSVLTFAGVKAGIRTLEMTLTYAGGAATRSVQVQLP
jgi:hypothetical protein